MTNSNPLCTPWSLHFDRDGTEDYGIICDADGNEIVASHLPERQEGYGNVFWLPEKESDPLPKAVRQMQVMTAAPKLLDMLKIALATADPKRHKWVGEAQAAIAEATGKEYDQKEAEAARHLHRAAPRMYEALEACFTMLGHYHEVATGNRTRDRINEVRERAFAACCAAKGEIAF